MTKLPPNETEPSKNHKRLSIKKTLADARNYSGGVEKTFFIALIITLLVTIPLQLPTIWGQHPIIKILNYILTTLFSAGFLYLALRTISGLPIKISMFFHTFNIKLATKLVISNLIAALLSFVVFLLVGIICTFTLAHIIHYFSNGMAFYSVKKLVSASSYLFGLLLGINLWIRTSFNIPIIIDRPTVGVLKAIKLSFIATKNNFWPITALLLLAVLFIAGGIVTLGIGLIWFMPIVYMIWALTYRNLVGEFVLADMPRLENAE